MRLLAKRTVIVGLLLCFSMTVSAAKLRPFSLAGITNIGMSTVVADVEKRLKQGGFEILGTYRPYPTAYIFAVTSEDLKKAATKSEYGGFGAVIKVSVTEVTDQKGVKQVQVTYNNPEYISLAYNMNADLSETKRRLGQVVGFDRDYGGGEGIEEKDLPGYNYTFGLEDFYGFYDLVDHGSFAKAVSEVEKGLANNKFGIGQVYKLKIPGKQQVVYGLSLQGDPETEKFLNDEYVMKILDHKPLRRTSHLPYEIMVNGSKVIAMHAHFRLAVQFPEMHMFGSHSFGKLMDLPYDYEEYFTQVAGGKWPPEGGGW
ncbi:MAG: hypothetical protein PVG50_07810 [Thiohalophilus sp.]